VQGEIESALAEIKIIIETIAPWQSSPASGRPPTSARAVRPGPSSRRGHAQSGRRRLSVGTKRPVLLAGIRCGSGMAADG
jgi:hypothetical protein